MVSTVLSSVTASFAVSGRGARSQQKKIPLQHPNHLRREVLSCSMKQTKPLNLPLHPHCRSGHVPSYPVALASSTNSHLRIISSDLKPKGRKKCLTTHPPSSSRHPETDAEAESVQRGGLAHGMPQRPEALQSLLGASRGFITPCPGSGTGLSRLESLGEATASQVRLSMISQNLWRAREKSQALARTCRPASTVEAVPRGGWYGAPGAICQSQFHTA